MKKIPADFSKEVEKVRLSNLKIQTLEDLIREKQDERIIKLEKANRFFKGMEEKYSKVLSCINNEWQNVIYSRCLDDEPRALCDIIKIFNKIAGDSVPTPSTSTFLGYLEKKFVRYGFAEEVKEEGIRKWKWSDRKGELLPLVHYALGYSLKKNRPISSILGDFCGRESRGPYVKYRILMELYKHREESLTRKELRDLIPMNKAALHEHLLHLKKYGLVKYISCPKDKEFVFNKKNSKEVYLLGDNVKKQIALLVKSKRSMRFSDIVKKIDCSTSNISHMLSCLVMDQILYCDFIRFNRSKVKIKSAGIEAREMLQTLKTATFNRNFRKNMNVGKPSLKDAKKALELYFPHSRSYKKYYGPLLHGQNL